jgi:hypothetical protein
VVHQTVLCESKTTTVCGVWDGVRWDNSSCVLISTGPFSTACKCYNVEALGSSSDSAKEIFLDFASVSEYVHP